MLQVLSVLNSGMYLFSAARKICVALVSILSYFFVVVESILHVWQPLLRDFLQLVLGIVPGILRLLPVYISFFFWA